MTTVEPHVVALPTPITRALTSTGHPKGLCLSLVAFFKFYSLLPIILCLILTRFIYCLPIFYSIKEIV